MPSDAIIIPQEILVEVLVMLRIYEREANTSAIWEGAFAAVVMGILCGVLYYLNLPTAWHLTVVIAVSVVFLSVVFAHGIQSICNQVHISIEHLSRDAH